ncbi:hypothetical protein L1887_29746 [Cichorium endivia]|nr:hypothetical protein L1887_29746 [Cichorium endivia]
MKALRLGIFKTESEMKYPWNRSLQAVTPLNLPLRFVPVVFSDALPSIHRSPLYVGGLLHSVSVVFCAGGLL